MSYQEISKNMIDRLLESQMHYIVAYLQEAAVYHFIQYSISQSH